MSAAAHTQLQGIARCMEHWSAAAEAALDQAHNPHRTSASRVESLRFASRAESRAERLSKVLCATATEQFREAA